MVKTSHHGLPVSKESLAKNRGVWHIKGKGMVKKTMVGSQGFGVPGSKRLRPMSRVGGGTCVGPDQVPPNPRTPFLLLVRSKRGQVMDEPLEELIANYPTKRQPRGLRDPNVA